jgi:murein DD-endopeptidase MepM/ murein hydrolase activator NlpD
VFKGAKRAVAARRPMARYILDTGSILSQWGPRATDSGGTQFHQGADLQAPEGTPVYAMADGKVIASWPAGTAQGYGEMVIIQHDADDKGSLYAHLSQRNVRTGQRVSAGQPIGAVGRTTGAGTYFTSSPPHLHLEILSPATIHVTPQKTKLDPMRYLLAHGVLISPEASALARADVAAQVRRGVPSFAT